MKNSTLEVNLIGEGYLNFEIVTKLPEIGDILYGEEVNEVEKFTSYCWFDIPDGVWGYDLYLVKTSGNFCDTVYRVAIESSIPMDNFIENLWDNLEDKPHLIDIETARLDVQNFYKQDGWYLPADLTPETYMKAWNEYVRKHGDLDDNQ